jgi:hypothetical protein
MHVSTTKAILMGWGCELAESRVPTSRRRGACSTKVRQVTDAREISRTNCGCALVVLPDDSSRLVLCSWHSRWCVRASSVVLSGTVQPITLRVEVPQKP